jgi:putative transposase
MYEWDKLSLQQRKREVAARKERRFPWHRPQHLKGAGWYHISAACYGHHDVIGSSESRMNGFTDELLRAIDLAFGDDALAAWCVLPNHYHVLLLTRTSLQEVTRLLGRIHGRTSRQWNLQEDTVGRRCWYAASDRGIRSGDHYWAVMNYIHHNPVKHGYVSRWQDWPWSSARDFLAHVPPGEAARIWREYPVLGMGIGWDD